MLGESSLCDKEDKESFYERGYDEGINKSRDVRGNYEEQVVCLILKIFFWRLNQ